MPRASCRPDPVELLLRQVLQRSLLLAGATALVACSTALEVEDLDANDRQQPSGEADGQGPGVGPAGNGPQTPGPATGGPRDASASSDAGSTLDAAVEPVLRDAAIVRPSDAGPDVHAPPPPPGALGPALSCAPGMQLPIQASGIKPAQSFDYLAIRRRNGVFTAPVDAGVPTETWSETNFQVISETGARCASAPASACADKVAHHPQEFVRTGCVQVCWEISVVTTRGADVKRWAGVPELMNLLGSVDSADDALLLVEAAGYSLTCGKAEWTSWRSVPEGYEVYATRLTSDCAPIQTTRFHLRVTPSGEIRVLGSSVVQESGGCAGRKPAGLRSGSVALGKSALGDYLARIAHLEAASVVAFERLARELRAHGAPLGLLRGAIEARGDEVRHAEQLGQLALARGGQLSALDVKDLPVRELEEIALENTVEGCVRETFGALVGAYQAQHAQDAELRRAMVAVAADEARHAALSHRVQHWLEPRLSAEARERVRHARERAVFELAHEIATGESDELRREAGLPSPEMSHILLEELTKTLWSSPFNPRGHIALGSNS